GWSRNVVRKIGGRIGCEQRGGLGDRSDRADAVSGQKYVEAATNSCGRSARSLMERQTVVVVESIFDDLRRGSWFARWLIVPATIFRAENEIDIFWTKPGVADQPLGEIGRVSLGASKRREIWILVDSDDDGMVCVRLLRGWLCLADLLDFRERIH